MPDIHIPIMQFRLGAILPAGVPDGRPAPPARAARGPPEAYYRQQGAHPRQGAFGHWLFDICHGDRMHLCTR